MSKKIHLIAYLATATALGLTSASAQTAERSHGEQDHQIDLATALGEDPPDLSRR